MDLLQFVDQASEALKMALEKPSRNRRKGGKKSNNTSSNGTTTKNGLSDGRVEKGRSTQRSFVCQQKVLEALFNPKVLHPTADEHEQKEATGVKSIVPPLHTRRLPASFFKGPASQPRSSEMSATRVSPGDTVGTPQSYDSYPADFTMTTGYPIQTIACSGAYSQPMPYMTHSHQCLHPHPSHHHIHSHHHHIQANQPPLPTYTPACEIWGHEHHCMAYPEQHQHAHGNFHMGMTTASHSCCVPMRDHYDAHWEYAYHTGSGYGPSSVVESPTSVDSHGYASTLDGYSPSPEENFLVEQGPLTGPDATIKMISSINQLDVCVDDFYGVAHSFPSTSSSECRSLSVTTEPATTQEISGHPGETFEKVTTETDGLLDVSKAKSSTPQAVAASSSLPEFSYAFGNLCT